MNFSEILLQHMQKYYTKSTDLVTLLFAIISGFIAISAVELTLTEKISDPTLRIVGSIFTPVALLITIIYVSIVGPKNNDKVFQIEHAIILNQTLIDAYTEQKKKIVLELIQITFTKKNTDDKFKELIGILNSKMPT